MRQAPYEDRSTAIDRLCSCERSTLVLGANAPLVPLVTMYARELTIRRWWSAHGGLHGRECQPAPAENSAQALASGLVVSLSASVGVLRDAPLRSATLPIQPYVGECTHSPLEAGTIKPSRWQVLNSTSHGT
ncbi:hypothetical protein BD311DRAFT_765098 [Dichomitus squalens]|uniref:Uncharacterized protein n=1 Tax=Dichomitus squalens TaxID=114155 RepID=A0A4Q9MD17_9APHY|nr:hypothetical protein BD311DRAFT_765098 [Dichomitus squalens]